MKKHTWSQLAPLSLTLASREHLGVPPRPDENVSKKTHTKMCSTTKTQSKFPNGSSPSYSILTLYVQGRLCFRIASATRCLSFVPWSDVWESHLAMIISWSTPTHHVSLRGLGCRSTLEAYLLGIASSDDHLFSDMQTPYNEACSIIVSPCTWRTSTWPWSPPDTSSLWVYWLRYTRSMQGTCMPCSDKPRGLLATSPPRSDW